MPPQAPEGVEQHGRAHVFCKAAACIDQCLEGYGWVFGKGPHGVIPVTVWRVGLSKSGGGGGGMLGGFGRPGLSVV